MPTYVFLKKAVERGALAQLFSDAANPDAQQALIASLGGQVVTQHAIQGPYDFVLIAELPGDAAAGAVSLQCDGRGVSTAVLRAFSREEAATALSHAAQNG
jgi:uncharacterized protein with GYD domain